MTEILSEQEFYNLFEEYCTKHNLPVTKVVIDGVECYKGIRLLTKEERQQRKANDD